MRITKDPEVRRDEILDAAGRLFTAKGYDNVTISDIADEIKVAKGTIYHYFKSKDELLEATILRYVVRLVDNGKLLVKDKSLSSVEKFARIADINALTKNDEELKEFFAAVHPRNAEMKLQRLISQISIVPHLLIPVIEQGIREGIMHTKYPVEVAEMIVVIEKVLFEGLFEYEPEVLRKKIIAYVDSIEVLLHMEEGALAQLVEKFEELGVALRM